MPGNEKVVFHEKLPALLRNTMKIVRFDEFLTTRESIWGNFRPCGLGWGAI